MAVTATDTHRAIRAVFKIESAKLIASLARMTRDIGQAEELAQDAMVAALERWPQTGIPEKPAAWLMAAAKNRAIDNARRKTLLARKHEEIGRELEEEQAQMPDPGAALDDDIGDDLLRLIFTACHPVVPSEGRVALTLRLLGGLTTDEIARSFLQPEPTIAQRIVRAKKTIAQARVPFVVPQGLDRNIRLASVLEVIYLIFNEGYSATAGDDLIRPALCDEALRLGRILAGLAPNEPEVHGLVALMEIQASRFPARTSPNGEPILLLDQNRARWDQLLIRRGLAALERAERLGRNDSLSVARPDGKPVPTFPGRAEPLGVARPDGKPVPTFPERAESLGVARPDGKPVPTFPGRAPGPYVLQAAIAACHARARKAEDTDWPRIAAIYQKLAEVTPSPVVELNRAVAVGMAEGPAAGLILADALTVEPSLKNYHLLPSVRGDLLVKLGRFDEAKSEFERAASLTRNEREKALLLERARSRR